MEIDLKTNNMKEQTFLQKLILITHFNVRWVRIIMILSLIAVIGILTFPEFSKAKETISLTTYKTIEIDTIKQDTVVNSIVLNKSMDVPDSTYFETKHGSAMVETTVKQSEPLDWKATITWGIGAMNGLILIVLNIKNILKKNS